MGSEKEHIDLNWILRRPLQIESLRKGLPDSEDTDGLLRNLQHHRENLDAIVFALSSRRLAPERREHLLRILQRHQRTLDNCFEELGVSLEKEAQAPLWYFNQLDAKTKSHLAAILGVPEEPAYFAVLDIKAEEYLAQLSAFEAISDHYHFRKRSILTADANRSAIVPSLSGSLIQLSVPISSKGA